jgi:hypothetical protein
VDPDSFESGSSLFCQSGSGSKPNPDPNPEPDPNRIGIEKKGWIRIQMNPDPQPWFFFIQFWICFSNVYGNCFYFVALGFSTKELKYL